MNLRPSGYELLAQEMELAREMEADEVSVLLICPSANREFRDGVTSQYLRDRFPRKGVLEIWQSLVPGSRFKSISTEALVELLARAGNSFDPAWTRYLRDRYEWDEREPSSRARATGQS